MVLDIFSATRTDVYRLLPLDVKLGDGMRAPKHDKTGRSRSRAKTSDASVKATRSNLTAPLATETSLKGIGVSPLSTMIHAPHQAKLDLNASYLSIA